MALRFDFSGARRDVRVTRNARFNQRYFAKKRVNGGNLAGANSVQPLFRLGYGSDDSKFFNRVSFSRREHDRINCNNFKRNSDRRRSCFGNFNSFQIGDFCLPIGNRVGFNRHRRQAKRQNRHRRLRRFWCHRAFSFGFDGIFTIRKR